MTKIAIIGGGISGLSLAYYLEQAGHQNIELFEASGQLGGIIRTRYQDGCVIEEGPESFATAQTDFKLLEDLGLRDEIIRPTTRNFLLGVAGKLRTPPKGMICLLYTSPSPRDLSTSRMPSSA